jgi:hypothetical protein
MLTTLRSTFALSRRPLALLAIVSALAAAACNATVIGGGTGNEGGGDTGPGGGSSGLGGTAGSGAVAPGPTTAIAEYAYMMPGGPPPGGSSSGSGGAPTLDPNTLYVKIGNYGPSCGGTFNWGCQAETMWEASIGIPPDMQGAGGVFPLSDPALLSTFEESGGGGQPNECWGGGGSLTDGTLEILSNDGATIVVRISGTNQAITDVAIDGQYTAPICQWGLD